MGQREAETVERGEKRVLAEEIPRAGNAAEPSPIPGNDTRCRQWIAIEEWTDRQRYAVATLCQLFVSVEARRQKRQLERHGNAYAEWSRDWCSHLYAQLKFTAGEVTMLDQLELDPDPQIVEQDNQRLCQDLTAISESVVYALFWSSIPHRGTYDARARRLVFYISTLLGIDRDRARILELECARNLQELLRQAETQTSPDDALASSPIQNTLEDTADVLQARSESSKKKRYAYVGAAAVVGGTLIGITGGLAAPLVGAAFGSILGAIGIGGTAAFFGSVGGIALITSVFSASGAGLSSYRMARRTKGISEFAFYPRCYPNVGGDQSAETHSPTSRMMSFFRRNKSNTSSGADVEDSSSSRSSTPSSTSQEIPAIEDLSLDSNHQNDEDMEMHKTPNTPMASPEAPSDTPTLPFQPPFVTISVSGWLTKRSDALTPWNALTKPYQELDDASMDVLAQFFLNGEHVSLCWETKELLAVGRAVENLLASEAIGWTSAEALKMTVVAGLMSAMLWPASILKVASVVDNPWAVALERARKTGIILADVLTSHRHGHRPVCLIGNSLGARAIFYALLALADRKPLESGMIQDVILLGMPMAPTGEEIQKARSIVNGRFVNAYCNNDWVLGFLYRSFGLVTTGIGGLTAIGGGEESGLVENVDLSDILGGHRGYRSDEKMAVCLARCGVDVVQEVEVSECDAVQEKHVFVVESDDSVKVEV